jgi:hypothetical protein
LHPLLDEARGQQAYQGAKYGWPRFLATLEQVLARID